MTPADSRPQAALTRRYALGTSPEWQKLRAHFAMSEGFAFVVLLVPEARVAELCRDELQDELDARAQRVLQVELANPPELKELASRLLDLRVPAETGAVWVAAVVSDAVEEYAEWHAAWQEGAARLNQFRNHLRSQYAVPLVFVGAPWLQEVLREMAPDLWSVRTLVVRVEPTAPSEGAARREALTRAPQDVAMSAGSDPEYALREATRLRGKPGRELQVAELLHRAGEGFRARLEGERAVEALSEAVRLREAHAPESIGLAESLNALGSAQHLLADCAAAMASYERALGIVQAAYGPAHPDVARIQSNVGVVLRDLGDLPGARISLERALRIAETDCGPDHPDTATAANNLGMVLRDLGDLSGARTHIERALRIDEASLGPEHPGVATDVCNLGRVLHDLGDLPGARAHIERALRIDEAAYGPDHPNVARDVSSLGMVLRDLGDLSGARQHLERALPVFEGTLGPEHPDVTKVLGNLGAVLRQLGADDEAEAMELRARAIREKRSGTDGGADS